MTRDEIIKNKANLCGSDMRKASMCGANLCRANMCGANLFGADMCGASMCGANLRKANMRKANLRKADMRGADMRGADMREADMRGADMDKADMRGIIGYIPGPIRSDGYRFDLRIIGGTWRVVAGCNTEGNWTTDEYRAYAGKYPDPSKTAETIAILDYLDARTCQYDAEGKHK